MIIALDTGYHQVNLFEIKSNDELVKLKKNGPYHCPICNKPVRIKAGMKRRAHFAHIDLSECENERKESIQHLEGKYDLYHFFNKLAVKVYLEKYIQEINQRPDLLVEIMNEQLCIEYQCSKIPIELIEQRTESFKQLNIKVLWIFGDKLLQQKNRFCYTINSIIKYSMINDCDKSVIYYNSSAKTFIILSSLVSFSPQIFVGKKTEINLENCRIPQLVSQPKINKKDFVSTWCNLKRAYRKNQHLNFRGSFYQLKEKMYLLQIDYLPAVVGIPLACNYLLNEHSIVWQGMVYLLFIHLNQIGEIIQLEEIKRYFNHQINEGFWQLSAVANGDNMNLENCVENYIDFLVQFRIVKREKNGKIMKIAHAIIPSSFGQALNEDSLTANTAFDMLFNTVTDSNDY